MINNDKNENLFYLSFSTVLHFETFFVGKMKINEKYKKKTNEFLRNYGFVFFFFVKSLALKYVENK